MTRRCCPITLSLASILLFAGCGQEATTAPARRSSKDEASDKPLVGKWVGGQYVKDKEKYREAWEFKTNGTVLYLISPIDGGTQTPITGKWKLRDEKTVELTFEGDDKPKRVYPFSRSGKKLLLEVDPKAEIESRLTRVD